MRKIKDPFFYNTIERSDFINTFIRAFTFRYDKYQENYLDMLDDITEGCYAGTKIGDFMCYYSDGDYFIHNMSNNVIIGWYKHLGRCNCVNVKGFTANDLYQFFKELRMACYEAGKYHIVDPEQRAEINSKETRQDKTDPAYQKQMMYKVTMSSMYGVIGNPVLKHI